MQKIQKIKVIAPWREWNLKSRKDLIKYANDNKVKFSKDKKMNHLSQWMQIFFILHMKEKS